MNSSLDRLVGSYVRLLVFQYRLPRAMAHVAIFAKQLLMDAVAIDVRNAYDVATAVGPQLDVLGKYVGLDRMIGDPAPLPYFGFWRYSGSDCNANGFRSYVDARNPTGVFFRSGFFGTRNTALSDASYALLLALKIILNSSDGTLASIQRFIAALVPGAVSVKDNGDMTLTYTIMGPISVSQTLLSAYLPRPMGVGVTIRTADFLVDEAGNFLVDESGNRIVTS